MGGINLSKEFRPKHCEFGVMFTRLDVYEELEANETIQLQKSTCLKYARLRNLKIIKYFGGRLITNNNEIRKEIIRMHYFIEKYPFISSISLTSTDRIVGRLNKNRDLYNRLLRLDIDLYHCASDCT
jgi:hypothetical protein